MLLYKCVTLTNEQRKGDVKMDINKKLPLILLSATIMTTSCYTGVEASSNWSKKAVDNAIHNGIIKDSGDIKAKDSISRAELVTMINRVLGTNKKADLNSFNDVKKSDWYYEDMAKAVDSGIIKGVGKNKLNPAGKVSREEAFTILSRVLVLESEKRDETSIKDLDKVSTWAQSGTTALVEKGYVNGDKSKKINPKNNITREEFIQLLDNVFNGFIKESGSYEKASKGNLIINVPNVSLKNMTIDGDLIIGEGVGEDEISLENVEVKGRIIVRGSKSLSLNKKSLVSKIVVNNKNSETKIIVDKDSKVEDIDSKTKVEVEDVKDVENKPAPEGTGNPVAPVVPTPPTSVEPAAPVNPVEKEELPVVPGETTDETTVKDHPKSEPTDDENNASESFRVRSVSLEDDYILVLEYTNPVKKVEPYTYIRGEGISIVDKKGNKISSHNIYPEHGKIIFKYDTEFLPSTLSITKKDIFTDANGKTNLEELNLEVKDNRSMLIKSGIFAEKMGQNELKVRIPFNKDLDIFSFKDNLKVVVDGEVLTANKKIEKNSEFLTLCFDSKKELKTGDKVFISFDDVKLLDESKIERFELERELVLDKNLDSRIAKLQAEADEFIFDLTSPVGLYGLHQEMSQREYWPTPAFENALNAIRDNLDAYGVLIAKIDSELEEIKAISGDEYSNVASLEESRAYLAKAQEFATESLIPRGDAFIKEANKTEAIKRRMRDIAYKLHHHRVHSLLMEPEKLEALLDSMPGEREEAAKIELAYMEKMAVDDIDEMEAKLQVVKVASDFYNEEDWGFAYTQIENVKKELMRLPAAIGNELYSFIEDKINACIEYEATKGNAEEVDGVFKVEEVSLLDGNIVEIRLSNSIASYDQHFKDTNCMFIIKDSAEEGYEHFLSVKNTEIELNGKIIRLTPRDSSRVPTHFEAPQGVPVKDARGMTPQQLDTIEIKDLRTK